MLFFKIHLSVHDPLAPPNTISSVQIIVGAKDLNTACDIAKQYWEERNCSVIDIIARVEILPSAVVCEKAFFNSNIF